VVSAYVLFFAGFLLLSGRVADLWGRRRTFVAGLALFTAASLCCGLSVSPEMLVASRAVQGLGAAITAPAALSIITTIFEEGPERDRAVAAWTAVAAGGGAAGLLLGGLITDSLGWEWIFFVNVPVGVAGIALSYVLLPESRDVSASRGLDLLGAGTVTAGLVLLVLGLTRIEEAGLGSPPTLATLGSPSRSSGPSCSWSGGPPIPWSPWGSSACAGWWGQPWSPSRSPPPPPRSGVLVTLYLQNTLGYSASFAGLTGLPFSLCVIAGSVLGRSDRRPHGRQSNDVPGARGGSVVGARHDRHYGREGRGFRARGRGPLRAGPGLRFGCLHRSWNFGGRGRRSRPGLGFHEHLRAGGDGARAGHSHQPRGGPHRGPVRWYGVGAEALVAGYRFAFLVAAGVASLGVVAALYFFRRTEAPRKR
jgi:MFS family permease